MELLKKKRYILLISLVVLFISVSLLSKSPKEEPTKAEKTSYVEPTVAPPDVSPDSATSLKQEIYIELSQAEKKAREEANSLYPDNLEKNNEYKNELIQQYQEPIMKKHNLTSQEKTAILVEGVQNKWPEN